MAEECLPDNEDDYDIYGKTPPRTKILRKIRERKHRDKIGSSLKEPSKCKFQFFRRNTVSTMYDDLDSKWESTDSEYGGNSKKSNKRQIKLLRGSERDLKLDIASAKIASQETNGFELRSEESVCRSFQIESCKRFMSLSGRTTLCQVFNKHNIEKLCDNKDSVILDGEDNDEDKKDDAFLNRVEFHQTLSLLIRMGCSDKQERGTRRNISREEYLWRTELKDLIWLELRAFLSDRTCIEEDEYLISARKDVEGLLSQIMTYKFKRQPKTYASQNSDSGIEEECPGCLSMDCVSCLDAQTEAMREIDDLTSRLEKAESLFSSGKAFAELYPLYSSIEFIARVKTINLWYNMTKIQSIKLMSLARFLACLDSRTCQWRIIGCDKTLNDSSSPSDSNNSSVMSNDLPRESDYANLTCLTILSETDGCKTTSPYRKYIENILKTKALNKSLNFLDKLHSYVLRKAQITLQKPEGEDIFKLNSFESEIEELKRYGFWSPEAQALNLPSYRSFFLRLATVPLDVIREFLLLRLEQKPENPSPLSVRQLMRELKEALKVATNQRQRSEEYIVSASNGTNKSTATYRDKLGVFDQCLVKVFQDYLDYLEQWALLRHETFQKNLLEVEWQYSCNIVKHIPNGTELLGQKFCSILSGILKSIRERLIDNIDSLVNSIPQDDDIKHNIFVVCRELQTLFNEEREMSIKTMSFCKTVFKQDLSPDSIKKLKEAVIAFKCIIPEAIGKVQVIFDHANLVMIEEIEKVALMARIREVLMQGYKFGFEFYGEVADGKPNAKREKLVRSMIHFANLWMTFVIDKCDRGRGMRPRWAYQGLEFLLTVCEPKNTKYLSEEEFEDLKKNMDHCISHVIGTTAPSTPESGFYSASPRSSIARSRGSSPSPRPTYKSQRSAGRKISNEKIVSPVEQMDSPLFERTVESFCDVKIKLPPVNRSERIREAIEVLEFEQDDGLQKQELIGKVMMYNGTNKSYIRQRNVSFTWRRGIKIGQGRFGKVYTAVNNTTGEMMAVKEVSLQPNDNISIKRVSEEMQILEGIVHTNLVKYYGMEVHRDEMLLFVEYCEEGTLESLVAGTENGLPELLTRRYTFQLVSGVECLHDHGIVHRDIKTANIFLTDEGNCLKIGDFGCAAKIKSNTTMPGELKGFVGTQAYMAPEVFTQNMNDGHGRAADIWSVGCVVVEMTSGKRPWAQYDSNYQIMFKVGMGQSPDPPDNLIDEGLDFLELCFKFNPKDRATARELLNHNFVKIGDDF